MKLVKWEFEGTEKELDAAVRAFGSAAVLSSASGSPAREMAPAAPLGETTDKPELTKEMAEKVLSRLQLSTNQKGLLQTVYAAGDEGITSSEIASQLGISRSQLAGVFGSLGRRATHTRGWPMGALLFLYEWDGPADQWRYWLPEVVKGLIKDGTLRL